jgi:hypothetical protein
VNYALRRHLSRPADELVRSGIYRQLGAAHRQAGSSRRRRLVLLTPPDGFASNLLYPRAAALDQNDQNDDNQYSRNDPDQHCGIHSFPLPQLFSSCSGFILSRFSTRFEPLNRNPDFTSSRSTEINLGAACLIATQTAIFGTGSS